MGWQGNYWLFLRQGYRAQNYDLKWESTRISKSTQRHWVKTCLAHEWQAQALGEKGKQRLCHKQTRFCHLKPPYVIYFIHQTKLALTACSFHPPSPHFCCCCPSRPALSDSLQPHGPLHARPACPSPSPGVCPSSCTLLMSNDDLATASYSP